MKEIREIIRSYEVYKNSGKKCALATVVKVEGSAYRKPGARMLISEDGQLTGAISGGCLEGDAMRKALYVINRQSPNIVTYDTMDEDDAIIGVGLGCNGIIHILIEPVDYNTSLNAVEILKLCTQKRQDSVIVTLFSTEARKDPLNGTRFAITETSVINCNSVKTENLSDSISEKAKQVLEYKVSEWAPASVKGAEGYWTAYYEYIPPAVSVVILGAGNDVIPLTRFSEILGWETTVLDGRANYANGERFAQGCSVIVSKPENVLNHISVDERTVFALMTHNYNYDKAVLQHLVKTESRYIAMLGPTKKLERMLSEFAAEGNSLTPSQLEKIYSPAGLDIGCTTPEEIALSIVAEINSVMHLKTGQPLKKKLTIAV